MWAAWPVAIDDQTLCGIPRKAKARGRDVYSRQDLDADQCPLCVEAALRLLDARDQELVDELLVKLEAQA